jgi:hypothetical protein
MATKKEPRAKPVQKKELLPSLIPALQPQAAEPEGEGEPCDQPCYEFNDALPSTSDDRKCRSCRKYLTTLCEQIEHFLDEDGDVD